MNHKLNIFINGEPTGETLTVDRRNGMAVYRAAKEHPKTKDVIITKIVVEKGSSDVNFVGDIF